MKRFLSLFLVLVLMLSTLASCNLFGGKDDDGDKGGEVVTTPVVNEPDIQEAVKSLNDMYKNIKGTAVQNGYEFVAQIPVGRTAFAIEWTTNFDGVTFTLVDGLYAISLPSVTEDTNYTITANLTSPAGQKASVTIDLVLTASASFGMITNPVAGVAYKLALLHGNEGGLVYFDGDIYKTDLPWYLHYSSDLLAAVDVYLEEVENVEGGYRVYFDKDGVKTYVVGYPRDGNTAQGTLKLDSAVPDTYWTYNTEYNTLVYTSVTGEQFYMGSSGTYTSISCSALSYITNATSYPCRLFGAGGVEIPALPEPELPTIPDNYTSKDVVEALYKLESGQTLEGPYEFTGVITSFKYAYDPAFNNVSVNIVVDGMTDKPVLCYRLNGGADLKVGDTITVFAGLTNYNGTYETTSGGVIRNVVEGSGTVTPPVVDNTAAEILNTLYALADGETATGTYTLTGKITELDSYNNPTIVVPGFEDKPVYCFKLVVSQSVGETITVTATTMKNYQGKYEFMNCTLVENGGNVGGDTTVPVVVDAPVAGTAYKFALVHGGLNNAIHYITGAMDGYYFGSTTDVNSAADVYLETADGGYYIYIKTGDSNSYLSIEYALGTDNAYHYNVKFTDEPLNVYTYDATLKTFVTTVEGKVYALGTASNKTYKTISAVDTTKGSYFCQFYTLESHVCNEADYSAPTCTTPATCPVCGTTKGEALGHTDGDKDHKCDVADCGASVGTHADGDTIDGICDYCGKAAAATTTEKLSVYASTGVLASDNLSISWTATNFTLTNYKGGSNTAIRTTDTDHFRVYQSNYVEITANNGKKVSQVVITINPYNDKTQSYIDAVTGYVASDIPGATATVDGYKITITLGTPVETLKIGATVQWRLNTIEVTVQ